MGHQTPAGVEPTDYDDDGDDDDIQAPAVWTPCFWEGAMLIKNRHSASESEIFFIKSHTVEQNQKQNIHAYKVSNRFGAIILAIGTRVIGQSSCQLIFKKNMIFI